MLVNRFQATRTFLLCTVALMLLYFTFSLLSSGVTLTLVEQPPHQAPPAIAERQEFDGPPPSLGDLPQSQPPSQLSDSGHNAATEVIPTEQFRGRPYSPALARVFAVTGLAMREEGLWQEFLRYQSSSPPEPNVNVLLASWRTGSTFIGNMLAHPGSFYHYEPLHCLDLHQARDGATLEQAAADLQQLAHCNISERYVSTSRKRNFGLQNSGPWAYECSAGHRSNASHWCWDRAFLRDLCQISPYRLIKTVRVRLHALQPLLEDSPNARVVVLGRDPRATKHSRRNPMFCKRREPLCDDPGLCSDMVRDYHTAVTYEALFPGRVRLMRYEDVVDNPMEQFQNLTSFYSLKFTETMQKRIKKNMNGTAVNPKEPPKVPPIPMTRRAPRLHSRPSVVQSAYTTVRDSKFEAQHWRLTMTWQEVVEIQDECAEAMRLWGYNNAPSVDQLRTFEPVGAFTSDIRL